MLQTSNSQPTNNKVETVNWASKVFTLRTVSQKLLVPIIGLTVILMATFGYISYQQQLNEAQEQARIVAEAVQRQVEADRVYYTANVAATALEAGLEVTDSYHNAKKLAIPLPATYIREVSEILNETTVNTEYELHLLSLFPINPTQGPRNEAERRLMEFNFNEQSGDEVLTTVEGQSFYSLYIPDVANTPACVTCHNDLVESPKRDYKLGDVMGSLVITVPMTKRLSQVITDTVTQVGLFSVILVLAGAVFYPLARRTILNPIEQLAVATQEISQGNLAIQVKAGSDDEIGQLVTAFNSMTTQLHNTKQRVANRTQRLEIAATLSERLNAILNLDQLLLELVNQIKKSFDYYHAHVYIIDDARQNLVMAAGAGEAGTQMRARGHSIPLNTMTSLVAQAARTGKVIQVDNVQETEDWLPNPLLPDTRSEIVVPIILEGQVMGVLDVQEDEIAGLDEGDASLLRSLANQVAVAIRNARLFAENEAARAEAEAAQARYIGQTWSSDQRDSQRGYYYRPGAAEPSQSEIDQLLKLAQKQEQVDIAPVDTPTIVAPIRLQNQVIGAMQFLETDPQHQRTYTEQELAFVQTIADQVAQTAENLRLFDETRQRAGYEQLVGEITEKLRQASNLDTLAQVAARELGNALGVSRSMVKVGETLTGVDPVENGDEK